MKNIKQEQISQRINILPRPFPDVDFYKSNLEAGFKKFPQRHENYLKCQSAKRTAKLDYLPVMLDIENVSRCNYHCTMCQVSSWPGRQRAADMSFDDFKALVDSQYGLTEIKLQGMGEPLLGKSYFEMIRYARDRFIWVRSSTNASLLYLNDNYKRLIDSDICEVQVSVDGFNEETYRKIRRGGSLKRVIDNSIMLNRYCDMVKRRRTRMWVVVQRENFTELERFVKFASDLGYQRLTFSLDLNDWGQSSWRNINGPLDIHNEFNFSLAERLVNLGKEYDIDVTFWFIDQKYSREDIDNICLWPFKRAYISSDMQIVPCCMVANPQIVRLGNARKFSQEWNAEIYQEFRKKLITADLPDYCRSCYES